MTHDQAIARMNDLCGEIRAYAGTEQMNLVSRLFTTMADLYRHELVNESPESLQFRQALAQQTERLGRFFQGDVNVDPKI